MIEMKQLFNLKITVFLLYSIALGVNGLNLGHKQDDFQDDQFSDQALNNINN